MEGKVYLLRNPLDGVVFYVGQTIYKLSDRLRGHMSEKGDSVKIKIISEILDKKLLPVIEELESMEYSNDSAKLLNDRELFWIKHYNPIGNRLHVFFCVKKCRMCGSEFESKSERKVFCSHLCRAKHSQANKKTKTENSTSSKFDKNTVCFYCKEEMISKNRNKKFCSVKCRVYFRRENVKLDAAKTTKLSPITTKIATETMTKEKELTKAQMWKLVWKGKM